MHSETWTPDAHSSNMYNILGLYRLRNTLAMREFPFQRPAMHLRQSSVVDPRYAPSSYLLQVPSYNLIQNYHTRYPIVISISWFSCVGSEVGRVEAWCSISCTASMSSLSTSSSSLPYSLSSLWLCPWLLWTSSTIDDMTVSSWSSCDRNSSKRSTSVKYVSLNQRYTTWGRTSGAIRHVPGIHIFIWLCSKFCCSTRLLLLPLFLTRKKVRSQYLEQVRSHHSLYFEGDAAKTDSYLLSANLPPPILPMLLNLLVEKITSFLIFSVFVLQ